MVEGREGEAPPQPAPTTMATTTIPATIATLDDAATHPLCRVITSEEVSDSPYRFSFSSAHGDDWATEDDFPVLASLYAAEGLPFVITVYQPEDEEAIEAEERQYRRDMADLWACHGPGR